MQNPRERYSHIYRHNSYHQHPPPPSCRLGFHLRIAVKPNKFFDTILLMLYMVLDLFFNIQKRAENCPFILDMHSI